MSELRMPKGPYVKAVSRELEPFPSAVHATTDAAMNATTHESSSHATSSGQTGSLLIRLLVRRLQQVDISRIELQLPGGGQLTLGRLRAGVAVPEVQILNQRAVLRGWFGGMIGWAEGYMSGDWNCKSLQRLTDWAMTNEQALEQAFDGSSIAQALNRLIHRLRPNSLRGSRRNIASHYDLGNAFYRLWLDPTMSYSSALYDPRCDKQTLEQAQHHKNRKVLEWLEPQSGQRVLEIGCGWGGLAEALLKREGDQRYHGITLSTEQLQWCRNRLHKQAAQALFELRDYRKLEGQYDRIVSIEMLEAVGEANWPCYFARLKQHLTDDGVAVLQVITIDDSRFESYRDGADFIQRYIFPGGMLPSPSAMRQQVNNAGLRIDRELSFGRDYARTLEVWRDNFERNWPQIEALGFDQRFKRMWRYYLAYCESGFKAGSIDVRLYQIRHA